MPVQQLSLEESEEYLEQSTINKSDFIIVKNLKNKTRLVPSLWGCSLIMLVQSKKKAQKNPESSHISIDVNLKKSALKLTPFI